MYLDANLQFDSTVNLTTTVVSTNVIDLGVNRDIGVGADPALKLLVILGNAFTSTNSATLNIGFQTSTNNSTWATIVETSALATSLLLASTKVFEIDVPRNGLTRYLRLNYVVGTGIMTTGSIQYAGIILDRADLPYYASGFTVSN